jgi:hypothetical protein
MGLMRCTEESEFTDSPLLAKQELYDAWVVLQNRLAEFAERYRVTNGDATLDREKEAIEKAAEKLFRCHAWRSVSKKGRK